ncbi:MAG: PVC-type heme-binding CxxCH protein, partial [Verrucomicrobiota bacterium]
MKLVWTIALLALAGSASAGLSPTRFADSELIKQPTGLTFTLDGKLLVVESNTHFRPDDWSGPINDQILWLRDTDGDGVADKRSVFYETDLVATMDIAVEPESGAIYVATRNEIFRLWDEDADGVAERADRKLVFLDTDGDYPHNGCSGLAFDEEGGLYFGIGENLGAAYTLRGSDGRAISDQGEGGNVWYCCLEGGDLRRVATGFWNPFGVCVAPGGHVFATDNDPSSRPPSRLHHIVEGGDYGYQYRYGRSGQHPFVSWDGELPGTRPMLAGTGEAPCDVIVSGKSLIVASWGDHRLECYPLEWTGEGFSTTMETLYHGAGEEFRPVAMAEAPDGSLYVSDWVRSDYSLHGEGAVWRFEKWQDEEPLEAGAPVEARFTGHGSDLLKSRAAGDLSQLATWARDEDETLRLLALKWISEEKLTDHRAAVDATIDNPPSPALLYAAMTARASLDGESVDERDVLDSIESMAKGAGGTADFCREAFRLVTNREKVFRLDDLRSLFEETDDGVFREDVLMSLWSHPQREAAEPWLQRVVKMEQDAALGRIASAMSNGLGVEAATDPGERPVPEEIEAWEQMIAPHPADPIRGRLVFMQYCAACHQVDGFGRVGGPDLSSIHEQGPRHILRSILEPGAEVSPQYQ